jgi:hypothetical protein
LPPSFLRFGLQVLEEHRPRGIDDGLRQFGIFHHIAYYQRLNRKKVKTLDEFANFLLDERLASVGYAFVDTRDNLTFVHSLFGAFCGFSKLTLSTSKRRFFCAKKAGIGDFFPGRKVCKRFQTNINTDFLL